MTEVRQVTSGQKRRVEWELTGTSHQGAFLGLEHFTCCSGGGRWRTHGKFIPLYNYGLYKTRTHWQLTNLRQMTKILTRAKIPDTPSLGQEPSPNSTHGQPWAPRCQKVHDSSRKTKAYLKAGSLSRQIRKRFICQFIQYRKMATVYWAIKYTECVCVCARAHAPMHIWVCAQMVRFFIQEAILQ